MFSRSTKTSIGTVAVRSLAAITIFLLLAGIATATVLTDGKLFNRATKAMRSGDYELAEKIYRELLAKDPHDNEARLGLSLTELKQRKLQAAYDNAARVILLDPLSAKAHALLGSAILIGGDFRNSYEESNVNLAQRI